MQAGVRALHSSTRVPLASSGGRENRRHMFAHSTVVIDNAEAAPAVRKLVIAAPPEWSFVPGQVAELATTPGTEGYFAIANAPIEEGGLVFLVKASDSDSAPLMLLDPGASLTVRGPFGAGFSLPDGDGDLLFVTAGTAIGAIRSAVVSALARNTRRIAVVIGLRNAADLCFADDIAGWRARGVLVRVSLTQPTPGFLAGRVQPHLADLAHPDTHAFIAGSEALEDEVTAVLLDHGVRPENIQRNYRPDARNTSRVRA